MLPVVKNVLQQSSWCYIFTSLFHSHKCRSHKNLLEATLKKCESWFHLSSLKVIGGSLLPHVVDI